MKKPIVVAFWLQYVLVNKIEYSKDQKINWDVNHKQERFLQRLFAIINYKHGQYNYVSRETFLPHFVEISICVENDKHSWRRRNDSFQQIIDTSLSFSNDSQQFFSYIHRCQQMVMTVIPYLTILIDLWRNVKAKVEIKKLNKMQTLKP